LSRNSWRNAGALALLSLRVAACSDSAGPSSSEDATGVYIMQTLNGQPTPVPLGAFYNYTLEYTSSTLSLAADNSYHERSLITNRVDGEVVEVDTADAFGLWKQNGKRVVLSDVAHSDSLVSSLSKGVLTLDVTIQDSLYHYVYKKRTSD
jgi:hypothetical protein